MEPERSGHGTLVDLLDRVLDRGLVLNADIIISLAGVPLIGLNLRLALAGIDTIIDYGVWDEAQRIVVRAQGGAKRAGRNMVEEGLLEEKRCLLVATGGKRRR
ncbi:MAG: gas vesicle protein [Nitrososphaerota archaeon]|nr:gas vesicle protein [Nitrososphaerota archaeon]